MRKLLLVPLLAALIPPAPSPTRTRTDPVIRPYVGLWGADSRIANRRWLRITDAETLQKTWLEHRGADPSKFSAYYNTQGVPDVDFDACMVLAVFQGAAFNSAGVRIETITRVDGRLRVRFDDRSYQTSGPAPNGGAQRSHAYGFFVVPRTDAAVVFEENVQGLIRGDPVWKERARLPALR